MRMNRKFKLTILTLAVAGTLCSCGNKTSEATPTPDNSPMGTPENRSIIVGYGYDGSGYNGYGYNGYNNTDGGMWDADNGTAWNAGDAARNAVNGVENATRGAVNDMGNAARNAVNDVRQGINDMARDMNGTNQVW